MSLDKTLRLRVVDEDELTVVTAGTPVKIPNSVYGEAVRFINNNVGAVVAIGRESTVDANSTPEIGTALNFRDSHIEYGKKTDQVSKYDQIFVDATVNGTKVTYQIMGT